MAAADFVDWWNEHSDSMAEWDWDNVAAAAWDAAVEFATAHNPASTKCPKCGDMMFSIEYCINDRCENAERD